MPNEQLIASYDRARQEYEQAVSNLEPLLVRMALERVWEALPNAFEFELLGEFNEDWLPTLRIQQIRSSTGDVLFDGTANDRAVADAIDDANTEYLDQLLDVTGDTYMGRHVINGSTVVQADGLPGSVR